MKRLTIFSCLALGLSALVWAQAVRTELVASIGGQPAGSAFDVHETMPDGNIRTSIGMDLDFGGSKGSIRQDKTYDATGTPLRATYTSTGAGGKLELVVVYSKNEAQVTEDRAGKVTQRTLKLGPSQSFKNASVLWFRTVKPKEGEKAIYWDVDSTGTKLEKTEVQYKGTRSIMVGKKKVQAHLIESENASVYSDDKGKPWLIEVPIGGVTLNLERKQ